MNAPFQFHQASRVLGLVSGRWVLAVLDEVGAASMRHSELLGAIDGVSEKVLTETLRRMERDGLIAREVSSGVANHVVYRATLLARSLDGPLSGLLAWQVVYWSEVEASRAQWDSD
jgi:DNA-binding HxlR family transcriptional regulator